MPDEYDIDRPNLEDLIDVLPLVRGAGELKTKIPDTPDISSTPETNERPATDAEFFVGQRYRPHGRKSHTGATFEIVEHTKELQHLAFDGERKTYAKRKGLKAPAPSFYVKSPQGTIGWVPWIGSVIAWPWEAAWEADLVEYGEADPKPSEKKK